MMLEVPYPQGSQEWLDCRLGIKTASEFKNFISSSTGKYNASGAYKYMAKLCSESAGCAEEKWQGNNHTDRGHRLEPENRDLMELLIGSKIEECGLCLTDDGKTGASPDGKLTVNLIKAGAEIKSPIYNTQALWLWEYSQTKKVPIEHIVQCHGGMAVTGWNRWYFFSNFKDEEGENDDLKPLLIEINRNAFTANVVASLDTFQHEFELFKKAVMA